MLSIACLYWNHKHTIALFARVEGTTLSTIPDTSSSSSFRSPRSRGRRHHHNHKLTEKQRTSPWRKSWYCTCSSASDSVMVANKQRNQKMGFGPVVQRYSKSAGQPKIFDRPYVAVRYVPEQKQNRHKMCSRKDERRASCRRRADPRGEGADHPARS